MKKIISTLKYGLMLCAGIAAASCSDVDDAMDTIPYSRVLTPLNFEAEVVASAGTDITFSWSKVTGADSYILELFEAPVTIEQVDGKPSEVVGVPDYGTALPAQSVEVSAEQIPVVIRNLPVDVSYWARVRAVSAQIESSHWAYLNDYVSTSAVRALLNPVVRERTENAVTIAWDDAEDKGDLTSVRYEPVVPVEGVASKLVTLTDEQIEACALTVSDLDACTNYKFTLLFGKSGSRGVVTAWTRPDTQGTTRIESSEAFVNALSSATGDLKLLLAYNDGATYDLTPLMPMNEKEGIFDPYVFGYGLKIYGESTEDGRKPVVNMALKNSAAASFHFEDLMIDGGNRSGVFFVTGAAVPAFEIVNCEMTGYTKGVYNGAAGCDSETLIFDNVYAHDINPVGAGGGDFIDIRGGNYGKIEIKNSTFYAAARSFLRISETATKEVGSIAVANCTFNQVTATRTASNNSGIFHVRYNPTSKPDSYLQLGSFTLTDCVFMNMNNDAETENGWWVRLTRDSNENYAPVCSGNIYYNVGHLFEGKNGNQSTFFPTKSLNPDGDAFTEALALADGGMMLDEDPCTNSIAGKMYLKNGVIAANRAGDPRWWNASEPVIVRPTELETVTEPTLWDFSEKTKFQTETLTANTIIENICIYATEAVPAEVVMNEGVVFSGAAEVNRLGVPQNNAVGFKAMGVGSVKVVAQSGGLGTVQVLAGEDRYTLLADGVLHTVVLGDQVGENMIYVLAGAAVTLTSVEWSDDLTPEKTTTALAAPKVSIDNTSFDQGTEVAVTASWAAVENAASYEVTFQGKKSETTETSFTVDAAAVAALAVGEYEIAVVAKPVATSSKYVASEAGAATFKVKKVVVGGQVSLIWNFDDAAFDAAAALIGTTDNNAADADFNGLHIESLGGTMKVENRADGRYLRTGGGGKLTSRLVSFVVPKDGPGTLKVIGANPSSSATDATVLTITANINKTTVLTGDLVGAGLKEATVFADQELKAGDIVYIYTSGGIRYKQFEYTYIDPNAGPVEKELVWDFTDAGFDAIAEAIKNDGSLAGNQQFEWDGLSFWMGGKTKYGTANINDVTRRFIQWGGKGKVGERSCAFTAPGPGTLTVVASNTGSGEDATRMVTVNVNGTETSQVGGAPSASPVTVTFDLDDVAAGTKVETYPTGNGLRFFSVKYTYME